jgi:hypothetical protein
MPRITPNNVANGSCGYSESFSKLFSLERKWMFTDEHNVLPFYLGSFMALSEMWSTSVSSLFAFVLHVVGVCSKPQVGRIHAAWVVAIGTIVKNTHSVGNRSEVENPTQSMGKNHSPIGFEDHAVSKRIPEACPQPTGFGELDFGKETLWRRFGKSLRSEVFRCNSELLNVIHGNFGPRSRLFQQREGTSIMIDCLGEVNQATNCWFIPSY